MTKHTPGPWKLTQEHTPSDSYGHWYHQIEAGDGYSQSGFCLSGIVGPADARLIAAAPALLEVALDLWSGFADTNDPALLEIATKARAAIEAVSPTAIAA